MKRQYLGDSKDSFKWDYHDFLVAVLGCKQFKIVWAMTPDDNGPDGKTAPELFPASEEILQLCHELRATRDPALLFALPARTGARYTVKFHDPEASPSDGEYRSFFLGVETAPDQVIFLDPDNGFEPERSSTNKHVRFLDIDRLIRKLPPSSVVTVFQHHRRRKFAEDFVGIRKRLLSGHSTALYWRSLMFVALSSSPETIHRVREVNRKYARLRPVNVLA